MTTIKVSQLAHSRALAAMMASSMLFALMGASTKAITGEVGTIGRGDFAPIPKRIVAAQMDFEPVWMMWMTLVGRA
jgi:hypothetical protein